MNSHPSFPLRAGAALPALPFAAARPALRAMAQEHELPILHDADTSLTIEIPGFGHYCFTAEGEGSAILVSAALPDRLHMLKEGFAEHLEHLQPGTAASLRWPDDGAAGTLPPDVQFTTVLSVAPLGRNFLRIRLQAQDLSGFGDDAIHFRLLLPPAGCTDPEYPKIDTSGRTLWPKGAKALHRPVYTARRVCAHSGLLEFDLFLHAGGRASAWAQNAAAGHQLAIAGPGGGGIPDAEEILLYADETAIPAAARILESLQPGTRGRATLLTDGAAACGYPLTAPPGISLRWLDRQAGDSLGGCARAEFPEHPGAFLWFAGEKSEVQPLRDAARAAGVASGQRYIAAYWSLP
ncbi:siderophore synthetase [Leisingera sp. ANG-M1]|uniref:siderophore-interacting protein n=1 Tax=Leisingera sp. ANG-M1 TaxID=1577895 RepID=UPI00057EEC8B|nr:siderophore-interacting protein [Leisingera sp. ANG-M1]KIC08807.1 siderophore synthetase [Leisingera sp. ANG-M1]